MVAGTGSRAGTAGGVAFNRCAATGTGGGFAARRADLPGAAVTAADGHEPVAVAIEFLQPIVK